MQSRLMSPGMSNKYSHDQRNNMNNKFQEQTQITISLFLGKTLREDVLIRLQSRRNQGGLRGHKDDCATWKLVGQVANKAKLQRSQVAWVSWVAVNDRSQGSHSRKGCEVASSGLLLIFVEILNNLTHIHRDYPDHTIISGTCIIHNLLYVDHQFT